MDAQISSTDALRRVLPTTVSSYLQFRGWTPGDLVLLEFINI